MQRKARSVHKVSLFLSTASISIVPFFTFFSHPFRSILPQSQILFGFGFHVFWWTALVEQGKEPLEIGGELTEGFGDESDNQLAEDG